MSDKQWAAIFENATRKIIEEDVERWKYGVMLLKEADFLSWAENTPHRCFYCGITEDQLEVVGALSQFGKPLKSIGIDRVNPDKTYAIDNMVKCCFICNRTKSNVFSKQEMVYIGYAIRAIWNFRRAIGFFGYKSPKF